MLLNLVALFLTLLAPACAEPRCPPSYVQMGGVCKRCPDGSFAVNWQCLSSDEAGATALADAAVEQDDLDESDGGASRSLLDAMTAPASDAAMQDATAATADSAAQAATSDAAHVVDAGGEAKTDAASPSLDAAMPIDAGQAEDANTASTVDARVDAAPSSTCGDLRIDDQREECDPTVPGWNRWTCTAECRVSRTYNVCGTNTDCGAGQCLFGFCTRQCTSTSECAAPIANTGVRPTCLPGIAWLSPPIPQLCGLIGCAVDSDCPPYQACSQPVTQGQPYSCAPRACGTNADCPMGVCRSTPNGLFCMAPL